VDVHRSRSLLIAIDGPSGAGKGTVARLLADRLQYRHVDTGAMYRAVAWLALQRGLDLDRADDIAQLAGQAEMRCDTVIEIDGHDVTTAIRTPEIDRAAARVAQYPAVRAVLVARQRECGKGGGVVMEGRDIGTVVFPSADVKIFLDAAEEERARRRASDSAHAAGQQAGVGLIAKDLADRDRTDRTRATSPLAVADDAVYIDTTTLPIGIVVERVFAEVEARFTRSAR
jgi:cytidylate kinase